jgi:hypothetical protein
MADYSVGGRNVATAATANHVGAQFWNPSTTRGVWVTAVSWFQTVATVSNPAISRSSARGATPTSTVTPDIDNNWDRSVAPPSACVLEMSTFGTQPTLAGPDLFKTNLPAAIGSGFIIPFTGRGVFVPSATGLVVYTPVAVILQPADVTFFWSE